MIALSAKRLMRNPKIAPPSRLKKPSPTVWTTVWRILDKIFITTTTKTMVSMSDAILTNASGMNSCSVTNPSSKLEKLNPIQMASPMPMKPEMDLMNPFWKPPMSPMMRMIASAMSSPFTFELDYICMRFLLCRNDNCVIFY